jgi:hypothetical protein
MKKIKKLNEHVYLDSIIELSNKKEPLYYGSMEVDEL